MELLLQEGPDSQAPGIFSGLEHRASNDNRLVKAVEQIGVAEGAR